MINFTVFIILMGEDCQEDLPFSEDFGGGLALVVAAAHEVLRLNFPIVQFVLLGEGEIFVEGGFFDAEIVG